MALFKAVAVVLFVLACCLQVDSRLIKILSEDERLEIDIDDEIISNAVDEAPSLDLRNEVDASGGPAKPCDPKRCKLPHCRCVNDKIPGNLPPHRTPQMIVLSFTNAVRPQDMNLFHELFDGRKNPNGCPATGTFFVSANWTYFGKVNYLYSKGHEIGENGVNEETLGYWINAGAAEYRQHIKDEATILSRFARIPRSELRGWRTPFLQMGGDPMASVLWNNNLYDSTRVAVNNVTAANLMWPFTYDYDTRKQTCTIPPCPRESWPGLWENPVEALVGPNGVAWSDVTSLPVHNQTEAYNALYKGFIERYTASRPPLVLQMKVEWLMNTFKMAATKQFLNKVMSHNDVYVVSSWSAMSWTQRPDAVDIPHGPHALRCDRRPPACDALECSYFPNRTFVPLHQEGAKYYTSVCTPACPTCYPALGDPTGNNC